MSATRRSLFSTKEVLALFPDLKVRTLISWTERGIIEPAVNASGTGSRRLYSVHNIMRIYAYWTGIKKFHLTGKGARMLADAVGHEDDYENVFASIVWDYAPDIKVGEKYCDIGRYRSPDKHKESRLVLDLGKVWEKLDGQKEV